jgi:hypothetical protein
VLPAAEHEAGHLIVAHHFGAQAMGITIGFDPARSLVGLTLAALYRARTFPVELDCIVKAAGPAADILYGGGYNELGASGDLKDIEKLTGEASLEPHLEKAKNILRQQEAQVKCIAAALRAGLDSPEVRVMYELPNQTVCALLLDEAQVLICLQCGGIPIQTKESK